VAELVNGTVGQSTKAQLFVGVAIHIGGREEQIVRAWGVMFPALVFIA